ncbi:MAG: hypothetical protein WCS20_05830 [Alphaproteobacteria bacterium]|jgi:hypothetical protein
MAQTKTTSGAKSGKVGAWNGVVVWNDPAAMAMRMIQMEASPGHAILVPVLQDPPPLSAPMTGVCLGGKVVGRYGKEGGEYDWPLWLTGHDRRGQVHGDARRGTKGQAYHLST